jgi:hypothetical protein
MRRDKNYLNNIKQLLASAVVLAEAGAARIAGAGRL